MSVGVARRRGEEFIPFRFRRQLRVMPESDRRAVFLSHNLVVFSDGRLVFLGGRWCEEQVVRKGGGKVRACKKVMKVLGKVTRWS